METFYDDEFIYSTDLAKSYVNIHKPKTVTIPVKNFHQLLSKKVWGNPKKPHSPEQVIAHPKSYKKDMKRIQNADLKYPIFMVGNHTVIDGIHRIVKATLENKRTIRAYQFQPQQIKKFAIGKNWDEVFQLKPNDLVELFYKRKLHLKRKPRKN